MAKDLVLTLDQNQFQIKFDLYFPLWELSSLSETEETTVYQNLEGNILLQSCLPVKLENYLIFIPY